jgi:hypothetical protein
MTITNLIQRWLPASGQIGRQLAVAGTGLALMGGLAAGAAQAAPATDKPTTAVTHPVTTATKPAAKTSAPSAVQLMPAGTPAGQVAFTPNVQQMANAKAIVDAGKAMKLPPRAWTIAVATSLQESHLNNYGHLGAANDHDSLGLFQQRPTSGWGTPAQVTDPSYSATAFYQGLANVPGYDKMPLTRAAQTVQVSAYPNAYAKWEKMAADVITGVHGHGPYADQAAHAKH